MDESQKHRPYRHWERALQKVAEGDARPLLELLLGPSSTDGQGNPVTFEPLPDDAQLRVRIVRALMARPDWAAGSIGKWMTHVGRGRGKPRLSDLELDVADMAIEDARQEGAAVQERESLADAHGIEPATLTKAIAKRRRKRNAG